MTHDHIIDRLSEYLDGELDRSSAAAIDGHLATCEACRAVADDLRQVAGMGAALPALPPTRELWPGIEARLKGAPVLDFAPRRQERRLHRWAGLVAAGLVIGLVAGGTSIAVNRLGGERAVAVAPGTPAPASTAAVPAATGTSAELSRTTGVAVSQLEHLLLTEGGRLDTATVRVLAQNLARIDSAIAEAERALAADPSNVYVSRHLAATTKRKIDLMRRVAVLTQPRS